MTITIFLDKLKQSPKTITFDETMTVIKKHYSFIETPFTNGDISNAAGQNSGSCQLFSFAQLHHLNQQQTLDCFGAYYREDVLQHPNADNHQNIRQFMIHGWPAIHFKKQALIEK